MTYETSVAPILVTGGSGTLGQHVLPMLRDAGHHVRVLSRDSHPGADGLEYVTGDLETGKGIGAAVDGTETILHLAGSNKGDDLKARHLSEAAVRAGVRHLVFISVVGSDRIPMTSRVDRAMFGYFGSKHAAEEIVASSGVPWTTLRATQFHDLMLKAARGMSKMPVMTVPRGFRFQPIDAGEVAERLVELTMGQPVGLVPDLAGPEVHEMSDLMRAYLRASGKHRLMLPMPVGGSAAAAFRSGANLAPERAVGRRTWEEFLASQAAPTAQSLNA